MHTSNDAGRRPCNSQGEPTIDVRSPDEAGGNSHHAPPSLSVDSSNSSFFSLANSTGFHTPLHDGSGHRRLFSSSNVAGGAGVGAAASRRSADVAAQLTSSEYNDQGDDDGGYFDVPLVYPKASRARLGSTPLSSAAPPAARAPGSHTPSFSASAVPTGVTRGSQRHHLAFSDSPPPKDSPLPSYVWHAGLGRSLGDSSVSSPKQRTPVTPGTSSTAHAAAAAHAAVATSKVDDTTSAAIGSHREGLFPTFGLPPPQTLDVSFPHSRVVSPTYAAGKRNQRENGVSSSLPSSAADTLKRSSGTILDTRTPALSTQASNAAHTSSRGKPLTSAHRYQEANDEEAEAAAAAVASAASSTLHNKASPPPPMQRSTFTGHAPPQLALSTAAPHAVTDCTSRQPATLAVHKNQLSADQLALLRGGPFVRRASASAAPFVPPGWRPAGAGRAAVRRHGSTTGPTIIADGLAVEDRRETSSPPHLPQRPSSTPAVERTGERRQSTPPPHYPAVRFIFTKSRSASKASSMDRSYEEASRSPDKKASPAPPVLSTALPPASLPASDSRAIPSVGETTTKKKSNITSSDNSNGASRAKKTMASYVFSTLRRDTAPALTLDGLHRHHSASVPFTRSATVATVSAMERHVDVMREAAAAAAAATAVNDGGDGGSDGEHNIRSSSGGSCGSARKRAVARRGSAERSATRDSRGSVEDFDAGPQSYLERWRQRQAEKNAGSKEPAVKGEVGKESMTLSHAESNAAQSQTVASSEAVAAVPENKENTPSASDVTSAAPAPLSAAAPTVTVTTGQERSDAAAVAASTLHSESSAAKKENEASKSHGGYSLSDALRSCSLPDSSTVPEAARSDDNKAAEQQRAESAMSVGVTATAESHIEGKTEAPASLDTAELQEGWTREEKAGSTAPAASSSSPALTQHSHTQQREQQQPSAEERGANPVETSTRQKDTHSSHSTSASLVKTSRLSNSSYLTEDYARRASVDEDIPEEQLAATAATAPAKAQHKSSTTASATTTAKELVGSPSPPPPPQTRKETNAVSAAATAATAVAAVVATGDEDRSTRAAKGGTPLPASTRVSARPSALISARGSSAVSPSGTEKADDGDRSSAAAAASSVGDVRDVRELCRAVLERREQRLQQQATEQEDGKEGRQLQPSPVPPPSLPASSRRARTAGNADDTKTDTHEDAAGTVDGATLKASRNSKLSSLSSPRRPSRSAPYTPPWKSGAAGGGSTAVSRPPSAVPDPALADTVLQLPASGRSTRTASRTLIPSAPATTHTVTGSNTAATVAAAAVPPTIAAPLSRFSAVGTGAPPQSEAASHATTPAPSVSNSASLRQERPALVVTPQEGGDAEAEAASREASAQRSSRISRLLARRRFSFPRQRAGAAHEEEEGEDEEEEESGGAALPNGSFRQYGRTQANASDPPSVEVPTLGAAKGSSTVPSGRVSNRSLAAAPGGGGGVGGGRHSSRRSRATPVTVSATQPAFDIAAAMESIPTVAEIEREAQRKEQQQQQQQQQQTCLDGERRTNHTTEPAKAALVNKLKSPERYVPAEREKPEAASGRNRQVSAAGSVVAAASSLLRSSPKAMDAQLRPMEAASSSATPAAPFSAGAARSSPQLPPSPRSPDIVKLMTAASPTATAAAATSSALLSVNTRGSSATALADIQADELDRLEQSVNAMLMQYGKSTAHTSPAKESTAGAKPTAADRLLSQMPEHAKTRASVKLRQGTFTAAGTRAGQRISQKLGSQEQSRQLPSSSSSSLLRPHACGSEVDDEDSHWNASLLWCGEETESLEARPPPWVPALDLTSLQLPTNESEDLKPYRIPLPTAVAAPDENRRHLWQLAGIVSAASGSPEGDRNLGSERGSDRVTAAGSAASLSLHHTASSSLTEVSPFVGERIRRMKGQPAELSTSDVVAAAAAARKLRAARRGSRVAVHSALPAADGSSSVVVGKGGGSQRDGVTGTAPHSSHAIISNNRNSNKNSSSEEAQDDDEEGDEGEDSLYEVVDDAPQRVSRIVRFTDDSDALDGGRGAARDVRVGQQKNRVRLMLLDCEEQRERKAVLAEEQNAFVIIGKSYRRSSLLT